MLVMAPFTRPSAGLRHNPSRDYPERAPNQGRRAGKSRIRKSCVLEAERLIWLREQAASAA